MTGSPISASSAGTGWTMIFMAWTIALVASLSVLFVGEIMGQVPCNLCWFQRAFMFPLAIILAIASFRSDRGIWIYAVPLAICGWLIAGFHLLLYTGIIPETIKPCGAGPSCSGADMSIFGTIPLPALSLAAFTIIIACLLVARRSKT